MSEALYRAVKLGRVKLEDLNEEGKEALRQYMAQKNQPSKVTPQPTKLDMQEPLSDAREKDNLPSPTTLMNRQERVINPTSKQRGRTPHERATRSEGMQENLREAYPASLASFSDNLLLNIPSKTDNIYSKKREESPIAYGIGSLAGQAGRYMGASAISPAIPGLNKIANPFIRAQATDLLTDNIAQTPATIAEGMAEGKGIGGIAKDIGKQNAVDLLLNTSIGGLGEVAKRYGPDIIQRFKSGKVTKSEAADIIKELNLPKDTTPESFLKEMERLSKEIGDKQVADQVENYYKSFETPPKQQLTPNINLPKGQQPTEPLLKALNVDGNSKLPPSFKKATQEASVTADVIPFKPTNTATEKILEIPTTGSKKTAFSQTVMESDLGSKELKEMIKNNPISYEPITNKETLQLAQEIVEGNFEAAKNIVKSGTSFDNAVESAIAQDVIRQLQSTAKTTDQWNEVFELMEVTAQKFKTGGQVIQSASMWSRMTPEGMLKYTQRVFEQANEALPVNKKIKITGEFAERITESMKRIQSSDNLLDLIKEQSRSRNISIPSWVENELAQASTERLNEIAIAQVLSTIADEIPVNISKKISSFQAISHLLNAKTTIRNILGNSVFTLAELGSTGTATIWDGLLKAKTGKRSVTLPKLTGALDEATRRGKESALDIALGINRTGILDGKYNVPTGRTFKGPLLGKAERSLRYALNVPDEFAKGFMGKNVRNQLEAIGGLKATEIDEIVGQAELYSTFQDSSLPAKILQGTKDLANKIGAGKTVRGSSGIMTKEFGVGDLIVKYTTVPGNIISRGVEYSPIGFLKTLSVIAEGKKKGVLNQRDLAMTLGRATNGTLLIGMGVLLNRMGLIQSEDKSRSLKALSLDRSEGLGVNKINMSAIGRLINGEDPKPQKGDTLQTFAWLDPLSIAFSVGASVDNEIKKGGKVGEIVWRSGESALEEMLDLPTLNVIRRMTYAEGFMDKAMTPIAEGASGFIPGPVRQLSQAINPVARDTYDKNPLSRLAKRTQNNIPGLGQKLEPRLSPYGEEIKYKNDLFNVFINPAQTSTYEPKKVSNQLRKLEELTGETTHYPASSAPSSFTVNKERIELTPQEKTEYQRIAGRKIEESYSKILGNTNLEGLNDTQRQAFISRLQKAQSDAREFAKEKIMQNRRR